MHLRIETIIIAILTLRASNVVMVDQRPVEVDQRLEVFVPEEEQIGLSSLGKHITHY
jgi:hypothetical protein